MNFPELPNVKTYGEWKLNIRRIMAGICNKPDDAVIWIKQAFDGKYPIEELRKKQTNSWRCLDVNLSIALSEKLTTAKNDNKSTPMLKQLVCDIQAEEGLAQQDNRFLMGREIIRHWNMGGSKI